MPTVSLIIATYNQPEVLRIVLASAFEQTRFPDEIVIADDGSREDTAEMIREMAKSAPVPVRHVWQPDVGFRLARSRNNAIAAASGEYLIFLDGDCFINEYFVADHLSRAEAGGYVVGTRVNIIPERKEYILRTGDRRISLWSWGTRKRLHAVRSRFLSWFRRRGGIAGANFSTWKTDVERINGFNEIYEGHGYEDVDFFERLERSGIKRKKMVHWGIAYHFAHPELPPGDWERIWSVYDTTVDEDKIRCNVGLNRAVEEGVTILNR